MLRTRHNSETRYALSRVSTRSSARLIHYYRCLGSDAWRHLGGPRCTSRPVRQDLLDETVWTEVMRLLEDPTVIQQELDRRLAVARAADPAKHRERTVQRDLVRVDKSIERMLTAYQEDLLSLEQLRERMPSLRQQYDATGSASGYLVWSAYGDGEVVLRGVDIAGSHVWLEGGHDPESALLRSSGGQQPRRRGREASRFLNNHYGIYMGRGRQKLVHRRQRHYR